MANQPALVLVPSPGPSDRTCRRCNQQKPIDAFYETGRSRHGGRNRRHVCKSCRMQTQKRDATYSKRDYARLKKGDPRRLMLASARSHAWRNKVPFDLTVEDIFIPSHCPILGMPLRRPGDGTGHHPDSPSLDRLIPLRGYVRGNVSVISSRANNLKNDGTAEDHERIAAWMRSKGAS